MLKITRVIAAILSFVAITLLFVDVTGFAASHWGILAHLQLVPAILATHLAIIVGLVVLTLLFGRLYCSVICPLGVYQDIVNWVSRKVMSKKKRKIRKYSPALTYWRIGFLVAFVAMLVAGFFGASLLEPYSEFGRMMTQLVRPAAVTANNGLADIAAEHDSYLFATVPAATLNLPLLVVAIVTFLIVSIFAWRTGRGYCNTICPVGTVLGFLSKYSWLRPVINTDKCIRCGKCGRECKAHCIDTKNHKIDYSRCVTCFDCIGVCKDGAITYSYRGRKSAEPKTETKPDGKRRAFLIGGAIVASSIAAKAADGGLAPIKEKQPSRRRTPIVPPGAKSAKSLHQHCTACQLCIANCPNNVLRPSTDINTFMQPVMEFNKGFCRPECTKCGELCPAHAIEPIDVPTKSSTKIGTAVVNVKKCISAQGKACGNCARRCPTGAITMIPVKEGDSHLRPLVNAEACIGCGSCEYHCPVGRASNIRCHHAAIHVEGIDDHRTI